MTLVRYPHIRLFGLAVLVSLAPSLTGADKNDDPNARYKAAMAKNDIEGAVTVICDAAKADPKKYEKKCGSAQAYAAGQLAAYEGLFTAGKAELGRRDYVGAVRDLSKIFFGPHREEAQHLLVEANDAVAHPQKLAESRQALAAALLAYDRGDLTAAAASAREVTIADQKPEAQRILTNVRIYEDTIKLAESAMQEHNYAAAQQQYSFALKIKSNGPGDPNGKLQELAALLAPGKPQQADNTVAPDVKPADTAVPGDRTAKIKAALADAHTAEGKKNAEAALAAYGRVLALDPRQPEALAGKAKILEIAQKDVQGLETKLISGIRSFYSSHLAEAGDSISLYLNAGGARNKGAAHFYLGATFTAKALLANPQAEADQNNLRQLALQEFELARREHYKPVERYISPRVLAVWNKNAS